MRTNIPPKQSVNSTPAAEEPSFETPFASEADESGALVSIHNAALHANPDSFPVLKAFQDYLETERKRARQRLIMLSAFFAILLVAVMIALISIGVYVFGNMSQTQSKLLTAVLENKNTPQVAASPVLAPEPQFDPKALADTIEERIAAALANAQKTPPLPPETSPPTPDQADLEKIKAEIAALRQENEQLRSRPQLPPSVGPIIPRAEVAHILDRHTASQSRPATPPTPEPSATVSPPITTPPATVATRNPSPPAPKPIPKKPAPPQPAPAPPEIEPTSVAKTTTPPATSRNTMTDGKLTLELPSKKSDSTIPWRVTLPPRTN